MKNAFTILAISALSLSTHPALAASKQEAKMLKSAAECTYVVQIAEENGIKLKNSSDTWANLLMQASDKLGLDAGAYYNEAKAEYESRAKTMGADNTLTKMIDNARKCDNGL
ncbi:MAG: hypothetical protein V7676_16580 [Parasphingorhabdus sp.]|uniref:hypothetical protein n=1 Tax=Parasphingorhabdus sp. TaxID=2709688 RepID=UPI003001762D